MATSPLIISAGVRVLTPVFKDIYDSAKGEVKQKLKQWSAVRSIQGLAKKIASVEIVKTIWDAENDRSLLKFYYPAKVKLNDANIEVGSIKDLPSENIVIEGIVGQGKSIFLRYLTIQELSENGTSRIPIFIELRTITKEIGLKKAILTSFEKLDVSVDDEVLDYLFDSGKVVLLLDAFDELDTKVKKEVFNELEFYIEKYEKLQVIITSRPNDEIQKSRHFKVLPICTLIPNDYIPFLKSLNIAKDRCDEIAKAIKSSPSKISEVINTPLLLTLVVFVYQSEKEIPSELPEFFQKLFQVVFSKHDSYKGGFQREHYSGLSERKLQELFESFCFMTLQSGYSRSLDSEQFDKAFKLAVQYTSDCQCHSNKFKQDITKVACLMLEEGIDSTTFLHKSILEYHAAAFVKHSSEQFAKAFYEQVVKAENSVWEEVLRFLNQIDRYRFTKFFLIPRYDEYFQIFGGKVSTVSDSSFEKIGLLVLNKSNLGYSIPMEGDNLYKLGYLSGLKFGPFYSPLREAEDAIVRSFFGDADLLGIRDISKDFFVGLNVPFSDRGHDTFEVSTYALFKLNKEHFLKIIENSNYKLLERLAHLKLIVENEEKKMKIFDLPTN